MKDNYISEKELGQSLVQLLSFIIPNPEDVVRVIQCKNCKYFLRDTGECIQMDGMVNPLEDDFCSRGELDGNNGKG